MYLLALGVSFAPTGFEMRLSLVCVCLAEYPMVEIPKKLYMVTQTSLSQLAVDFKQRSN